MDNQVLVTYASKYGSTAEIAEKIGQVLRDANLTTDVQSVNDVKDPTIYEAVILGSAVYIGKWRKEAVNFLKNNQDVLAERLVWLFSSGPTGEGEPEDLLKGWRYPEKLQPILDRIQPRDIAIFHGALEPEQLGFIERWMIKNVDAPIGDFRDWDSITTWATQIAGALMEKTTT